MTESALLVIIQPGMAMTSEQRLDRLERIARLFIRAGLRARRDIRNLDDKIAALVNAQIRNEEQFGKLEGKMNIMVDAQIRNEERFARSDERFAKFEARMAESDERFAKFEARMAESDLRFAKFEVQTDRTLKALLKIVRKRNGNSTRHLRN